MAVYVARTLNVITPEPGTVKTIVVIADNTTDARMIAGRCDDIFLDHDLSQVWPIGTSDPTESTPGIVAVEVY